MADSKKRRRKWLEKAAKAAPIVTGVGGAVVGHQFGAVAGGAFTAASAFGARYAAEAGARGRGKRRSADKYGAQAFRRTLIGGGAGTVAGAGVAALQEYGKSGHANAAIGTFFGGQQDLLGISTFTRTGLNVLSPSVQKAFGFTPRAVKSLADKAKGGKLGDWKDGLVTSLKGGKDEGDGAVTPAVSGGSGGPLSMLPADETEAGGGSGAGLAAAAILGLLVFAG